MLVELASEWSSLPVKGREELNRAPPNTTFLVAKVRQLFDFTILNFGTL
jgi:hypothetical protein